MPNILVFDLELSPLIGAAWNPYDTNLIHIFKDSELLSFAYQWYGEKTVTVKARTDYKDKTDKALAKDLWALFQRADILIGHNIDAFDVKRANERFLVHRLGDPSHYRTIDTLKVYKRRFKGTKNSLNYICQTHGIGSKVEHQGAPLWIDCMNGDPKAWKLMKKYNKQDVVMTTKLYEFLLPWIDNHPNMSVMLERPCCPNCGVNNSYSDGRRWSQGAEYRRLRCKACGTPFKETIPKRPGGRVNISGR